MQPLSSKQNIQNDPLQEWVSKALNWIANHRQTFYSIVSTLVILFFIAAFMIVNFKNLRQQSWEKYFNAQNWIMNNNPANAMNLYNEVLSNYNRTPAAAYALFGKGDLLRAERKFPDAISAYQQCLEKNPNKLILPMVYLGLGTTQEDQNQYPDAIATYKKFIEQFPDHYLTPKIYESLARTYELSVNPDSAKDIYEKIITLYPGTIWSEKARVRYQTLAPQPFQNATPNISNSQTNKP